MILRIIQRKYGNDITIQCQKCYKHVFIINGQDTPVMCAHCNESLPPLAALKYTDDVIKWVVNKGNWSMDLLQGGCI